MRKLKLRDDASPTKLTEPGFVQEFEPGQTHEVPDPIFEDYRDGSLFEAVEFDEDEAVEWLESKTVKEVQDYVDDLEHDQDALSWIETMEEFAERQGVQEAFESKAADIRENLKSTDNQEQ